MEENDRHLRICEEFYFTKTYKSSKVSTDNGMGTDSPC